MCFVNKICCSTTVITYVYQQDPIKMMVCASMITRGHNLSHVWALTLKNEIINRIKISYNLYFIYINYHFALFISCRK
jgi:hypothetical protein